MAPVTRITDQDEEDDEGPKTKRKRGEDAVQDDTVPLEPRLLPRHMEQDDEHMANDILFMTKHQPVVAAGKTRWTAQEMQLVRECSEICPTMPSAYELYLAECQKQNIKDRTWSAFRQKMMDDRN